MVLLTMGAAACLGSVMAWAGPVLDQFQERFTKRMLQVRQTVDRKDDVQLGQEMFAYARQHAEQDPQALVEIHKQIEALCKLSTDGYGTIVESWLLIADNIPDRRDQSLLEAEKLLLKMARLVPERDRKHVGNRLLDVQMAIASDYLRAHEWEGASTTFELAIAKAQEMGLEDRVAQIRDKMQQIDEFKKVSKLEWQVKNQPLNFEAAKQLVMLYVVELDQPEKAVEYRFRVNDERLKELVYLASKGPSRVTEDDALRLGDWYGELAETASAGARPEMHKRAKAFYEQYLEMHRTDDAERQRAETALRSLGGEAPKVALIKPREVAVATPEKREPLVPKVPAPGSEPKVKLPSASPTPAAAPSPAPSKPVDEPAPKPEPKVEIKTDASGAQVTATGVKLADRNQSSGLRLPSGGLSLPGSGPSLPGAKPAMDDKPKLTLPSTAPATDPKPEPTKVATPTPAPTPKPDTPAKPDKQPTQPDTVVSSADGWIDLIKPINTVFNVNRGEWKVQDDGLWGNPPTPAQLSLPHVPEGDYVCETAFTLHSARGAFAMQLPFGNNNAVLLKLGELYRKDDRHIAGLSAIGNRDATDNETTTDFQLETGRKYVARVEVRGFGGSQVDVKFYVDGKKIIDWKGSASSCSVAKAWGPPRYQPHILGLATDQAGVIQFHFARLKMLSGKANLVLPKKES